MIWRPVLTTDADGREVQERNSRGDLAWVCEHGVRKLYGDRVGGNCRCGERPPVVLPPLGKQFLSLLGAVAAIAASGFRKVSADELRQRLEICGACPYRTETNRCGLCGCRLRFKPQYWALACPLLKWPGDKPAAADEPTETTAEQTA